ncbi:NAD(P)-binding protein [Corynespora cassiicola Philippines]|uniref:NAD(P)-binding protein n=1 Tax=Corynespora cassiicola Philippines TaxID=1448308 RepID=A0A2T2N173_CORCC|nr:NAD(P)-binding protein [Corynespora cassiicola Philippines]
MEIKLRNSVVYTHCIATLIYSVIFLPSISVTMPRYTTSHLAENVAGPGDARPTALQIVKDEGLINKLEGKIYLVTGVSSGIGVETFRALHATGADVYGTVRDVSKGKRVVDGILAEKFEGKGRLELIEMDLSSFKSVRHGAKELLEKTQGRLNGVIANAGHFLLFQLLKDALLSSATPDFPSRYVSVASQAHRLGSVHFKNINFTASYDPWLAYGQSKTANIWLANAIERHFGHEHLHATSVHPGVMMDTGLAHHFTPDDLAAFKFENPVQKDWLKNSQQGAATQVLAAIGLEWKDKGGRFLANCEEQNSYKEYEAEGRDEFQNDGYAEWVYDSVGQERLWKESLAMVSLKGE